MIDSPTQTHDQEKPSTVDRLKALADRITEISPSSPHDDVAMARVVYGAIKADLDECKGKLDGAMIEWISTNHQEVVIGPVRYYVTTGKTVKCKDIRATANAFISVMDLDQFADCLSTGAFKPATTKKALIELGMTNLFDEHFETIESVDLVTKQPKKVLASTNDDFLR